MRTWPILFTAIAALLSPVATAADAPPDWGKLTPVPLRPGINRIAKLTPDGRDGVITMAWRDNGNAHGFDVFTVMVHEAVMPPGEEWTFASFFDGDDETLAETDAPHTTEDYVRSVRFARATMGKWKGFLALVAKRNTDENVGIGDPTTVTVTVFKLTQRPEDAPIGRPRRYFERVATWNTERRFCNSETALAVELKLPLPTEWPGNKLPDGCP